MKERVPIIHGRENVTEILIRVLWEPGYWTVCLDHSGFSFHQKASKWDSAFVKERSKKSSAPIAASWQVHIFIGIKITQYKCLQNPEQKLSYTHTNNIPKNKRKKSTDEMGDTQCMTSGIILVSLAHLCYVSRYCLNQWTDSRMQRQIWLTYKKKKKGKREPFWRRSRICAFSLYSSCHWPI